MAPTCFVSISRVTLPVIREIVLMAVDAASVYFLRLPQYTAGALIDEPSGASRESGFLARLRTAALIAVAFGAVGSLGLMFRASQRTPPFLVVIFFFWVLSPVVALVWASVISTRWSVPTRATLYVVMLVVALGSLAAYGDDARGHRRPQAAFVYVVVPPLSWLLGALVLPIAAFLSGTRRSTSR